MNAQSLLTAALLAVLVLPTHAANNLGNLLGAADILKTSGQGLEAASYNAHNGQQALMGGLKDSARGAVSAGPFLESGSKANLFNLAAPKTHRSLHETVPLPGPGRQVLNDVSLLNPTEVFKVVRPTTVEELQQAVRYARAHGLKISIGGSKMSMGGHTLYNNSLHIDMTGMKKMHLDPETGLLNIQSGATWKETQRYLDPRGYALKVMQTPNVFTVGGTLGANAHGSNPDDPPVSSVVKSIRLINADGALITCSREENVECFKHAIGGYGLFGVIVDAQFEIVENEMYVMHDQIMDYTEYPAYERAAGQNPEIKFAHALVSVAPDTLLKEIAVQAYHLDPGGELTGDTLQSGMQWNLEQAAVDSGFFLMRKGKIGRWMSWFLTSRVAPRLQPRKVSRNNAMNLPIPKHPSSEDEDTQIIQDYFIPRGNFVPFMDAARETIRRHDAQLLIAAVRPVSKDVDSALPYAPQDVFSIVMFYNHKKGPEGEGKMAAFTRDLVDAATAVNGRMYLTYRPDYTKEQFDRAYPEGKAFFEMKRTLDPEEMFMNKFYEKYGKK